MSRWEYEKINLNDVPRKTEDIDLLSDAGKEGWELVGISVNNIAYLKRQPEEKPLAEGSASPARRSKRAT
jgi:hypothetical protein